MQAIDLSNLNGNFQPVFLDNDFLQNFQAMTPAMAPLQ